MSAQYATHEIDGVFLEIVLDQASDGTWTASWWFPIPLLPERPAWADGSGNYPTREAAEEAAIEWSRQHGPQR